MTQRLVMYAPPNVRNSVLPGGATLGSYTLIDDGPGA